ncbi:hypothetical protein AWB71_02797 [Caballeronia peredens]|nr:hypothetical protein AWB71_02797 [Caballeronia peredens]
MLKRYEPTMEWVQLDDGRKVPLFRDARLRLVEPFTDHVINLLGKRPYAESDDLAERSEMQQVAEALKFLLEFLSEERLSWRDVDDATLWRFLSWNFERIRRDPRSRTPRSAKRTANLYMVRIYEFLRWAQEDALLCRGMIGLRQCRVTSAIALREMEGRGFSRRKLYPVRFLRVGEGSRESDTQYWASDDDFRELEDYFWRECHFPWIAHRNVTILSVARAMGWRPSSIRCLTADMFTEKAAEDAYKRGWYGVPIEPTTQKLNRGFTFFLPFELYASVRAYITDEKTGRQALRARLPASCDKDDGYVFESSKSGLKLSRAAMTEIFGDAYRVIGAPRGASMTSFRRKFFMDAHLQEIQYRKREGLSLDSEDVKRAVADKMGHASTISQSAYSRARNILAEDSAEARLQRELIEANAHIASLEATLAAIRGLG